MEELNVDLNERRVDGDGVAYTFQEYVVFYGFQTARTLWQTNSAEQPVDIIVGHSESHDEKPGDINSAAQPVDIIATAAGIVQPFATQTARWWHWLEYVSPPLPSSPLSSVGQPAVSVPPAPPPTAPPRDRIRLESPNALQPRNLLLCALQFKATFLLGIFRETRMLMDRLLNSKPCRKHLMSFGRKSSDTKALHHRSARK